MTVEAGAAPTMRFPGCRVTADASDHRDRNRLESLGHVQALAASTGVLYFSVKSPA